MKKETGERGEGNTQRQNKKNTYGARVDAKAGDLACRDVVVDHDIALGRADSQDQALL